MLLDQDKTGLIDIDEFVTLSWHRSRGLGHNLVGAGHSSQKATAEERLPATTWAGQEHAGARLSDLPPASWPMGSGNTLTHQRSAPKPKQVKLLKRCWCPAGCDDEL